MTTTTRNPMTVAVVVAFAFFLENFDGTVIATALPEMALAFGSTPVELSIGITAYMLTVAIFISISGWMADRFGAATIFRSAILLFTVASILCGLSQNLTQFTAARILQGIGGAMMIPVGRLIVLRSVERKDFVRAMSFVTVPSMLGQVLGPPVGGFITTYFSWQWIFFINIPIGIIGFAMVSVYIKNFKTEARPKFDWTGFILTGISIGSFIYGLDLLVQPESDLNFIAAFIAVGFIVGAIGVWHARRASNSIIDLKLLNIPTFLLILLGGFGFRMTVGAIGFLLPLQMQVGLNMTAFASGLLTLFVAVGALLMKTAASPILRQFGFRNSLLINGSLWLVSIFSFGFFGASTSALVIGLVLFMSGIFRALQFTSINTLAYADVTPDRMSSATSLASTADRFAIGVGVSVSAIFLHNVTLLTGSASPFVFNIVFAGVALLALISILPLFRLTRDAGGELSGHVPR
jgi:EmrB/QacA subfamily drug resistance transporter